MGRRNKGRRGRRTRKATKEEPSLKQLGELADAVDRAVEEGEIPESWVNPMAEAKDLLWFLIELAARAGRPELFAELPIEQIEHVRIMPALRPPPRDHVIVFPVEQVDPEKIGEVESFQELMAKLEELGVATSGPLSPKTAVTVKDTVYVVGWNPKAAVIWEIVSTGG